MSRYDPPLELRPNAGDGERVERIQRLYTEAHVGMSFSKADIFRMALAEGLQVLNLRFYKEEDYHDPRT